MTAISVSHLGKSFGKVTAVDDLSFDVPSGAITAFLGPNGAGKPTNGLGRSRFGNDLRGC